MNFIHGNIDGASAEAFVDFHGHKSKSCHLRVLPDAGVLAKSKPKRNSWKAVREYGALHVWSRLLESHHASSPENGVHVVSPTPLALGKGHEIFMTLMHGVTGGSALTGGYQLDLSRQEKRDVRMQFATAVGRLRRIMENESMVHGDLQLRHLIINPHTSRSPLSVIDVERTSIASSAAVQREHARLEQRMIETMGTSERCKREVRDALDLGYQAPIDAVPRLGDIVADVRRDLRVLEFDL